MEKGYLAGLYSRHEMERPKEKTRTKTQPPPSARNITLSRIKPSRNRNDQIRRHEQRTLQPMTLAVLNEVVNEEHRNEEDRDLEAIEVERHGLVTEPAPADDDHEGQDEEGDLHGGADGDADGEVHLVFDCDGHGGRVFCVLSAEVKDVLKTGVYGPAALPTMGSKIKPTNSSDTASVM